MDDDVMSLLRAAYLEGYRRSESNTVFVAHHMDPEQDERWCQARDSDLRKMLGIH